MRKKTALIHGGTGVDRATGAVTPPIYQTSTYKQDKIGQLKDGYEYSRTANPTRTSIERLIADLEGGARGFAFGSGMAAIHAVFHLLESGDHIVMTDDVYGGTFRLMQRVLPKFNIQVTFVDTTDLAATEAAIQDNTKIVYVETPTNPLLKVTDIAAIATIAKRHDLKLVVDNTFATPYHQQPLALGADIVLHSATKYIGGHSDVVAGLVVVKDDVLGEELHFIQNSTGGVLGPQDSFLLVRGLRTLGIRMDAIEETAHDLVAFLQAQDIVSNIFYPGLASHPGHDIQAKQATGFGGMISFDVGSAANAEKLVEATHFFTLAESLGAVESLISVPARMTHASIPAERRAELGITDGLVRISVGLEDAEDLKEDLTRAFTFLEKVSEKTV
ncbi:bifunctional cystathionine gamma-lyase/homocysteine desulfhydrase [Exiguobacterium sp. s130]|uniref:bifunctional cystathionine gamma-lyase/homocysteine desulfhydrase n=1 Tax=Exiguobacterium sp. s130 TaxID=2751190 RepID=UPI001BE9CAF7|nr:bifunctional cystathionine gamma-lyase/homocysteine desulfhydrase [Exiguobacterium sp. s130]